MLTPKGKGEGENKAWGDQSPERANETLAARVTRNTCLECSSGHSRKALSGLGRGRMEEEGTRAGHGQQALLSEGREEPAAPVRGEARGGFPPTQAPSAPMSAKTRSGCPTLSLNKNSKSGKPALSPYLSAISAAKKSNFIYRSRLLALGVKYLSHSSSNS